MNFDIEMNKELVENTLRNQDEQGELFPSYTFKIENDHLVLLGKGGGSLVYEMISIDDPQDSYALKVVYALSEDVDINEDLSRLEIQQSLSQTSPYICDIVHWMFLELAIGISLQLILMKKMELLIERNRFGKRFLLREGLADEHELLKFACQIGQALATAHEPHFLHRDIKLENILWDEKTESYILTDLGEVKWTENGIAETIIFSGGYGAPEIVRGSGEYDQRADIYSFGVMLYLLLNDLKFPASDGYYANGNVQYQPGFIFPAPMHASPTLAAVICRMCSYYPEDRYESVDEVMDALLSVSKETTVNEEPAYTEEMLTETFCEEDENTESFQEDANNQGFGPEWKGDAKTKEGKNIGIQTRAERKQEQKKENEIYILASIGYYIGITLMIFLILRSGQSCDHFISSYFPVIISAGILFEAAFQKIRGFHILFGTLIMLIVAYSAYKTGIGNIHILGILCILIDCSLVTAATGTALVLWLGEEMLVHVSLLDKMYVLDLGWIMWIILIVLIKKYMEEQWIWDRMDDERYFFAESIYKIAGPAMILTGGILWILLKFNILEIPDAFIRLHLIRIGVLVTFLMWVEAKKEMLEEQERKTSSDE